MAEPSKENKDLSDVLDGIREQMEKRKELRAQKETSQELKKLNVNLAANKGKTPDIKFPSAEDITRKFMKSSPLFSRAFSGWIKDTAAYSQASNDELIQIHKDLSRVDTSKGDDDHLEYLDLISDQLKSFEVLSKDQNEKSFLRLVSIDGNISKLVEAVSSDLDGSAKQLLRIDSLDNTIKSGNVELLASNEANYEKMVLSSDKIVEATNNSGALLSKNLGDVVHQLIRLRGENTHDNEQILMRINENIKDSKNESLPKAESVTPTAPSTESGSSTGGFLAGAGALAALGLLKKVIFAPLTLIKGITKIFSSMGSITKLLKGVGRMVKVGPLALLSAAIDFGKGFFNAKEILGKSDVSILDRVRAGLSEVLGGFGDMFDWVAKLFGFDTDIGKTVREGFLNISKKPFEIAQSVVDWFKNDLFAGIDVNTSLSDIPGILSDNLKKQIILLVDNIKTFFTGLFAEAVVNLEAWSEEVKKNFNESVKKPFYKMVNTILDTIFGVVDKFIDLIPDALGGKAARQKMADAKKNWKIEDGPEPVEVTIYEKEPWTPAKPKTNDEINYPEKYTDRDKPEQGELSKPTRELALPTQEATVSPEDPIVHSKQDTTSPAEEPKPPTKVDDVLAEATSIAPIQAATPMYGKAATNTQDIKSAQKETTVVNMPVNNVKNNVNNAKNTTILNSPSLQPSNDFDTGRMLWDR